MRSFSIRFWPADVVNHPRVIIEVQILATDLESAISLAKQAVRDCEIVIADSGGAWHGRTRIKPGVKT